MAITSTQQTEILKIVAGLFNAAPGGANLTELANLVQGGMTTSQLANALAAHSLFTGTIMAGKVTTASQVAVLMKNFGFTADSDPASAGSQAQAYFTQQINANVGFGKIVYDAVQFLSGSVPPEFTAAATLLSNKALVAAAYSDSNSSSSLTTLQGIVANVTGTAAYTDADVTTVLTNAGTGSAVGQTFTLTTGADNKIGTASNDVFDASQNASGTNTLSALDSLDGGAGTDTLSAVLNGGSAIAAGVLKGIENIDVSSTANNSGINLSGATGVTNVNLSGSTATGVVSGLSSTSIKIGMKSTSSNATFTYNDAALAGASDTVTVVVDNVSAGTLTIQPTSGTNGAETIDIVSNGAGVNTVATLDDGASTSLTKVVVTGLQGLTITNNLLATVTTFDGSGNKVGGVDIDFDAGAVTATGGEGNDVFSFETTAGNVSTTGGVGNDSFQFAGTTQTFDASDTVDGGAGTDDKLILVTADAQAVATSLTKLTNIEHVQVSNASAGAINFTYFGSGVNAVTYAGGVGSAAGDTLNTGTTDITLKAAANTAGMALTANGTGTADAVTISFDDTTAGFANNANITGTGVEALTINVNKIAQTIGTGNVTLTASGSASTVLNVKGGFGFTANKLEAKTIDASGMTVSSTSNGLVMGAAATTNTAQSITGSGGLDTLIGSGGNDSITAGAGNDAITSGAGNDTVLGGDGNDTLTFAGEFTTGDSIDGGAGTDTISVSSTTVTALNALSLSAILALNDRVGNLEKLSFSNDFGSNFDLSRIDGISDVTLAVASNSNYVISSFSAAGKLTLTQATNSVDATLSDGSGTADVFGLVLQKAATTNFGTVTVGTTASSGMVETVNVSSTEGTTPNSTVRTHTVALDVSTGLKTLNLSGTENITSTVSSDSLATVNAADLTEGAANITATSSIVAMTVTGSAQGDTFSTGSAADSVSGAAGDDNLTGGSGNDTLDGGIGNDTIVNGVGVDSLVGGDGVDLLSQTGWTISTTTDGGSTAVLGTVVNLGTTSVSAATIAGYVGYSTTAALSSDLSAVASNQAALLGAAATIGSRVDSLSGFENVTGSTGKDYIVGSSVANTITGGTGADVMTGGTGADTFVIGATDSVVASASSYAGVTLANNDTITFGNAVDIITDFTSSDLFDVATAGTTYTTLAGFTVANNLTAGTHYYVQGTYVASTGVFTVNTAATSATTNYATLVVTEASAATIQTQTDVAILVGVVATDLTSANFV